MLFWPFGNTGGALAVGRLVEDEALLEAVMAESELVAELRAGNVRAVEFLAQEPNVTRLVEVVMDGARKVVETGVYEPTKVVAEQASAEDDAEEGDKEEVPLPPIDPETAVQVLLLQQFQIADALVSNQPHLQNLWDMLGLVQQAWIKEQAGDYEEHEEPTKPSAPADIPDPMDVPSEAEAELDPPARLLASWFLLIFSPLLDLRPDALLNFLRRTPLVDAFLPLLELPVVMDFLLRIVVTDRPDLPSGILELLVAQRFVPQLLERLLDDLPLLVVLAAGDLLRALVAVLAATPNGADPGIGPNDVIRELVSPVSSKKLTECVLRGGRAAAASVALVIEIIRKNNSDYDEVDVRDTTLASHPPGARDPVCLEHLLTLFLEQLAVLVERYDSIELPVQPVLGGEPAEPLGPDRFRVGELVAELLHCLNMKLVNDREALAVVAERDRVRLQKEDNIADALEELMVEDEGEQDYTDLFLKQLEEINRREEGDPVEEVAGQLEKTHLEVPTPGDQFKTLFLLLGLLSRIIPGLLLFPFHNFHHNVVFDLVQQILQGPQTDTNDALVEALFAPPIDVPAMVIRGHQLCTVAEIETGVRLGYMGHLVLIAEEVVNYPEQKTVSESVAKRLADPAWTAYVLGVVEKTREMYSCVLGGIKPNEKDVHVPEGVILLGDGEEDDEEAEEEAAEEAEDLPVTEEPEESLETAPTPEDDDDDDVPPTALYRVPKHSE